MINVMPSGAEPGHGITVRKRARRKPSRTDIPREDPSPSVLLPKAPAGGFDRRFYEENRPPHYGE